MYLTAAYAWSVEEFGKARLGNHSRTRRVVKMGAAFVDRGTPLVTEAIVDDDEREGAYRLLESDVDHGPAVAASSYRATVARCAPFEYVFVPVDGSSLNMADPHRRRGTGPIGDRKGGRGFLLMNALAVSPDGVPLGLLGQAWWRREETPPSRHANHRKVHEKETQHWVATHAQVRGSLGSTTCRPWFQEDRGGDAWPVLRDHVKHNALATVRASHDRRVAGSIKGERHYLWPKVEAEPPLGQRYSLEVPAGPKRKARVAAMEVRAADVTLLLKNHQTKTVFPTQVVAVLTREVDPPEGEPAIAWMLLTTYPVKTFEDAARVIWGYCQRWRIEEFHRALKSGGCNVEKTQLQSESGMHLLAVLLGAVATRLLRLTYLPRKHPDLPASEEFAGVEIRALLRLRKVRRPRSGITLAQAATWLAELGGYTGRQSGGPPGFITLGRGLRRLRDAAAVLAEEIDEPE